MMVYIMSILVSISNRSVRQEICTRTLPAESSSGLVAMKANQRMTNAENISSDLTH